MMRRYTTVKSNVYAPVSMDLLSQNMIHKHMASHYRMTYFAKSKVDSSPPWKYKSRDLIPVDRKRKCLAKHGARSGKPDETLERKSDINNHSLVDRIINDTKYPPSAYNSECLVRLEYAVRESKIKDGWPQKNSAKKLPSDVDVFKKVCGIPAFNIPIKSKNQISQSKSVKDQVWNKKLVSANKRNIVYGKNTLAAQERLRDCITRTGGKTRTQVPLQSRCRSFKNSLRSFSSGSEGNAGDDEDGTPSSCDDSNPKLRKDCKPTAVSRKDLTSMHSLTPKCVLGKDKDGSLCMCIRCIKEIKNVGSRISSMDSAYEGGGGISSSENHVTSPSRSKSRTDWYSQRVDVDYEKGNESSSHPAYLFSAKSELHMKFLQDITDDILMQEAYSNEALEGIIQVHIKSNSYNLDMDHINFLVKKLREDLGIPSRAYSDREVRSHDAEADHNISGKVLLNANHELPIGMSSKFAFGLNKLIPTSVIDSVASNGLRYCPIQSEEKRNVSRSSVVVDQGISMSRSEVLGYLADLGFETSLSEEIFQTLIGKCTISTSQD